MANVNRPVAGKSNSCRCLESGLSSRALLCSVSLALCCVALGCRSGSEISMARQLFHQGSIAESRAALEQIRESDDNYKTVADLDLAILHLADGNAKAAEKLLLNARQQLDEAQIADPAEATLSYVTDDTNRDYSGAGYEHVLVRSMLAMSSVMDDGIDAEAFALQAQEKQNQLQRQAEEAGQLKLGSNYEPLALAPYLRGMLRESHHQDYDDASRYYRLVSKIRPSFTPAGADIVRANSGTHSASGNGVLYVFAFVGRGPIRVPQTAEVTSDVLLAADRIVSAIGKYSVPPTVSPIEIPAVAIPPTPVDTVHVLANNQPLGLTQSLADIGQMALQQFEAERQELLVRAVARRIVKKSAVAAGKDALSIEDPTLQLLVDLAGSLWEATEKTDTRCWGLLPRDIQILRAELPIGTYDIGLQSFGNGSPLHLDPKAERVQIRDGGNTYIIAIAPVDRVLASSASCCSR